MIKKFILSMVGLAVLTVSASAQYYPQNPYQQNPNNPYQQYYPYQDQGVPSPYKSGHTPIGHPGQSQKNYYWCNTHNRYCGHTPYNQNYNYNNQNNNQGYWHEGRYYPNNNGQYETNRNSGRRSWRRGQGNNPPPGHYWCNTHDMYCSH